MPPPPAAPNRRISSTNPITSSTTGPKASSRDHSELPSDEDCAITSTWCFSRSGSRLPPAKPGTWVWNDVEVWLGRPWSCTGFFAWPSMVLPWTLTLLTFPRSTCVLNCV
jgi:hypothetical protein